MASRTIAAMLARLRFVQIHIFLRNNNIWYLLPGNVFFLSAREHDACSIRSDHFVLFFVPIFLGLTVLCNCLFRSPVPSSTANQESVIHFWRLRYFAPPRTAIATDRFVTMFESLRILNTWGLISDMVIVSSKWCPEYVFFLIYIFLHKACFVLNKAPNKEVELRARGACVQNVVDSFLPFQQLEYNFPPVNANFEIHNICIGALLTSTPF